MFSLIALTTNAEIGFTQIKGLYDPIPETKKQCSPVHGFNWWKTGIIENFWTFGDQDTNTIKLIRDLFYLQPDGVTFDVTSLARKPAKYLNAKAIGQIIALINRYTDALSTGDQESLKIELFETIKKTLNFDQLVAQAAEQIASAKKEIAQLSSLGQERVALQKKIITNERALKQLNTLQFTDKEKVAATQNKITKTKTEIAAMHQQLETIKQRLEQKKNLDRIIHNNDLNEQSLRLLAEYIVGSLQETLQEKYVPYATHQILLAFLWKKINDKAEFLDYFATAIPGMNIPNRSEWLQEEYTKEVFSHFKKNLDDKPELATSNYQLNSFVGFSHYIWNTSGLPLLVSSISDATYQVGDKKYQFPDCGEASLRNFLNIRIYNATTGTLDYAILETLGEHNGFTPNSTLGAYYKKHNNITKIQTKPYYDAWTQVVSGLPGVEYLNEPGYEISPRNGLSNMLTVINNLLFDNSDEFNHMPNSKKLDYLVKKLSDQQFKLSWKAKKIPFQSATQLGDTEDLSTSVLPSEQVNIDDTNVGIRIIFSINNTHHFSWKFTDNHFVLSAPHAVLTEHSGIIGALTRTIYSDITQALTNANLLCWYINLQSLSIIQKILSSPVQQSMSDLVWDEEQDAWVGQETQDYAPTSHAIVNNYLILLGMSLNLQSREIVMPLLNFIFMRTPGLADAHQILIRNLVHTLPIKDTHYADQVGWAIVENHVEFLYPLLNEIPIGPNTVRAIISAKDQSLYPLAQKIVDRAYDQWADVRNKDAYITLIHFPELMNLPRGQEIIEKFKKIEELKEIEDAIFNAMMKKAYLDKYKDIIRDITQITNEPLSPQADAQLGNILELILHPDGNEHKDDVAAILQIITLILKKTKYKPNIEHIAKHTIEDELDDLYESLHEAIIANANFYDLVLDILTNKRKELYKTVQAVAEQTTDKALRENIAQRIRTLTIQELYPLADTIEGKTKKEEQVVLTLPQLFNSIVEFAYGLFSQVVTKLSFKHDF